MSNTEDLSAQAGCESDSCYTIMISRGGSQSRMATLKASPSRNFDFISCLALIQHLRIDLLPFAWQAALDRVALGGTAEISQSLVSLQLSCAFKRVKASERARWGDGKIFQTIWSEIFVLGQPSIRSHSNIVSLLGVCWEVCSVGKVWPVLVFEKSQHGDLSRFANSSAGIQTTLEDKLSLIVDVLTGVIEMHSRCECALLLPRRNPLTQQAIIHGDIKPENVLIFEDDAGRKRAKVADFGYSTCYAGPDDLISMPRSWPWNAPDCFRRGGARPIEAKKMDVYSVGMLCLWLLFQEFLLEETFSGQIADAADSTETSQACFIKQVLSLGRLKHEGNLLGFIRRQMTTTKGFQNEQMLRLDRFFLASLSPDSKGRTADLADLLECLVQGL